MKLDKVLERIHVDKMQLNPSPNEENGGMTEPGKAGY